MPIMVLIVDYTASATNRNAAISNTESVIVFRFKNENKEIEVILPSAIKGESLQEIIDKEFLLLQSEKLAAIFKNPDNVSDDNEKPRIRLHYNEDSRQWEPENFADLRRKWDELRNSINNLD